MAISDRKEDYHFKRWSYEVRKRDNHTCQICGRRGVYLNSHHINAWNAYPDERYDIDNGITLCAGSNGQLGCHDLFHMTYGKGNNTRAQFEEFEKTMETLIKTASFNCEVERRSSQSLDLIKAHHETAARIIAALEKERDGYGSDIAEE